MAIPQTDQNLTGTRTYPVTDLALQSVVGSGSSVTGTAFTTGVPATVFVLAQTSSGTGNIYINVADTAADAVSGLGSPTATLAISTTKAYTSVATSATYDSGDDFDNDTSTSLLWVAIKETAAAGGFQLAQMLILTLYELIGGEDWYCVRAGSLNAVAGTVGTAGVTLTEPLGYQDGSGALVLTNF